MFACARLGVTRLSADSHEAAFMLTRACYRVLVTALEELREFQAVSSTPASPYSVPDRLQAAFYAGHSHGSRGFSAATPSGRNKSEAKGKRKPSQTPPKSGAQKHEQQQPTSTESASADAEDGIFAGASTSAKLTEDDIGKYYPIEEVRISEAFDAWYQNRPKRAHKPTTAEGKEVPAAPHFVAGCRALQEEFAQSWYPYVMHREQHHALWQILDASAPSAATSDSQPELATKSGTKHAADAEALSPAPQGDDATDDADAAGDAAVERLRRSWSRVLVGGPTGAGKSMLLAATAEALRQKGWIVMYIPDATDITLKSRFFTKNEDTGMYDTRDSAQNILRALRDAHGKQLASLPQRVPGGQGSLLDLCNVADKGSDASVCNAVVRMKLELYELPPPTRSAVIIDNYNALFWKTPHGEVQGLDVDHAERIAGHRELYNRPIDARELTLAANLRVLGDLNNGGTTCIVAGSTSGQVPALPYNVDRDDYIRISVPLMSAEELGTMLHYYRYVHALAPEQEITPKGVAAAHLLTQGNGYDTRRYLHYLLPYDPQLTDLDAVGAKQAAAAAATGR